MNKRIISLALAAGSIAVAAGATLAVSPAHAETAGAYHGKVTSSSGLSVRSIPTINGSSTGSLGRGQTFNIRCKVEGQSFKLNNLWYLVGGTSNHRVSAH